MEKMEGSEDGMKEWEMDGGEDEEMMKEMR